MDRDCCRGGADDSPLAAALGDQGQAAGDPGAHATTKVGHLAALRGQQGGGACGTGPGAAYGDDRPASGKLALPLVQLSQRYVPGALGVAGLPFRWLAHVDQDRARIHPVLGLERVDLLVGLDEQAAQAVVHAQATAP